MADLTDIQAAASTKIIGSDATGLENTPVNATSAGGLHTNLRDNSGTEVGTRSNLLQVQAPNVVSTANSTTTPLAIGGVFTGTSEDVLDYAAVTVQVFSTHASASLGFKPQYSPDGTNWDDGDAFNIPAQVSGNGKFFTFPVQARFFRITYTNGAVAQTTFRLHTVFHRNPPIPSSHRIADLLDDENDSILVKSVSTARRSDGAYDTIKSTNNNEARTADLLDASGVEGAITVGTTAVAARVGGSNLTNRKNLTVYNNGTAGIFWGYSSGVTTSTGTQIFRNQFVSFDVGPNTTIYLISAVAGQNVRVTEGA